MRKCRSSRRWFFPISFLFFIQIFSPATSRVTIIFWRNEQEQDNDTDDVVGHFHHHIFHSELILRLGKHSYEGYYRDIIWSEK